MLVAEIEAESLFDSGALGVARGEGEGCAIAEGEGGKEGVEGVGLGCEGIAFDGEGGAVILGGEEKGEGGRRGLVSPFVCLA